MMALLKDSNCYITILCIINLFGGIKASNATKLVSMIEIQPSPVSEKENVETKNIGMECWSHCKYQQGPCPSWCGKHGMCCTMNPYWKDQSNGCDGTFGGVWRHECVYNEVILCMNDKKSQCIFQNETVCETSSILVNSSTEVGQNNFSIHEVWCPYVSDACYQSWDNTWFWLDGVMRSTIALIGIFLNIVFCYVLSQKQLRNVFNSLLISLAVFDTFYLVFDIIEAFRRQFKISSEIHMLLFPKFLHPFHKIMFCSSIFMTVSISLERHIAVADPISLHLEVRNDKKAKVKRFLKYLFPVFILSTIVNITKFFEATTIYDETTQSVALKLTNLRVNPDYIFYYSGITRLTVTLIVPFAAVIYLNAKTYKLIYVRRKRQNAATSTQTSTTSANTERSNDEENGNPLILRTHIVSQKEKHTSEEKLFIIFSSISLLFLVCHLPRFILDLDEAIYRKKSIVECVEAGYRPAPFWAIQFGNISNLFLTINSSLNSAIYCLLSRKYRRQARIALTCIKDSET